MAAEADTTDVAIIGAGNVGIAVAYYLVVQHGVRRVVLLEAGDPMALTSAQSGENYRNWWPHPVMTAFTDHAIGLLEDIARASGNRIRMNRRGYVLATRQSQPDALIAELHRRLWRGGRQPDPAAPGRRRPLPACRVRGLAGGTRRGGRPAGPRPGPRAVPQPGTGREYGGPHPPCRRHQRPATRPVYAGGDPRRGRPGAPGPGRGHHRAGPLHASPGGRQGARPPCGRTAW